MDQFDLKYREGLPLVLKQISCDIKPGEKVQVQKLKGLKELLSMALSD